MPNLHWPDPASIPALTEHQRSQVARALSAHVGILGGPPGTGKTFTAAAVIKAIVAAHGSHSVGVAAPTGKAAVRLMHAMTAYSLDLRATTIHRLLGVSRGGHDGKGWGFLHDESNPLPYRFLFIDESSMIDTDLAASLLRAVETGTHVLFAGDVGQLPPVGHGAPLRDMIAAGIPYGELTEIKRNAGDIVRACHAIRQGRPWQASACVNVAEGLNLIHRECGSPAQTMRTLQGMLASVPPGVDPIWDVQVLCAVNAKSPICRRELNRALQEQLNPHGEKKGSNPFRLGDKVICTSNTLLDLLADRSPDSDPLASLDIDRIVKGNGQEYVHDPENPRGLREFVANGEIGRVTYVGEKLLHVRFDAPPRTVKVPVGGKKSEARGDDEHSGAACDFDLAYAITVHKSQGSSARIVIYVSDDYAGARMVCCRELIYTALSRAEELCVTMGRKATMDGDCRRVALTKRKTFLKELLCAH